MAITGTARKFSTHCGGFTHRLEALVNTCGKYAKSTLTLSQRYHIGATHTGTDSASKMTAIVRLLSNAASNLIYQLKLVIKSPSHA